MPTKPKRRSATRERGGTLNRTTLLLVGAAAIMIVVAAGTLFFPQPASSVPDNFVPSYTGGPRIEVAEAVIDHGDVKFNRMVESVFRIQNVGDRPLRIQDYPQVVVLDGC